MLIKRKEEGNKVDVLYDSSNILASSWDKVTNDLTVTFKRGAQYKYLGVRPTDYTRFEIAESQGVELNKRIKNYKFEKLKDVETSDLVKEIYANKPVVMTKAETDLLTTMKAFISTYDNQGKQIDIKDIENVEHFLNLVVEERLDGKD